jgi:pimeloyl-ACP methyl ester carboxylesterase
VTAAALRTFGDIDDTSGPLAVLVQFARAVLDVGPGSDVEILDGVSHFLHLEQRLIPEKITAWLAG